MCGAIFAGLENDGVACGEGSGEGSHQWSQQEVHRVVPRSDDEHRSQGIADDLPLPRQGHRRQGRRAGLHPLVEALQGVADLHLHGGDLGDERLSTGFAEVGADGALDLPGVLGEHRGNGLELSSPPFHGPGDSGTEGLRHRCGMLQRGGVHGGVHGVDRLGGRLLVAHWDNPVFSSMASGPSTIRR